MKTHRPANITKGKKFFEKYCSHCVNGESCEIIMDAMVYDIGIYEYLTEFIINGNSKPKCKSFKDSTAEYDDKKQMKLF